MKIIIACILLPLSIVIALFAILGLSRSRRSLNSLAKTDDGKIVDIEDLAKTTWLGDQAKRNEAHQIKRTTPTASSQVIATPAIQAEIPGLTQPPTPVTTTVIHTVNGAQPAAEQSTTIEQQADSQTTLTSTAAIPELESLQTTETPVPTDHIFQNVAIRDFWESQREVVRDPFLSVLADVLEEYDDPNEQDTPCVYHLLGYDKETDNDYQGEYYDALRKIPLWRHALDAVEEFIAETPERERLSPMHWVGLVAVLGHDISKQSKHMPHNYATGAHAPASATVVDRIIAGRLSKSACDEIRVAISEHHSKNVKDVSKLTRLLRDADQAARVREMRSANLNPEEIGVRIPWLTSRKLLDALAEGVPNYISNKSMIFSMLSGYVYVTQDFLCDTFFNLAKLQSAPEATMFTTKNSRIQLAQALVKLIWKEAIATDLIKENYFSAPFYMKFKANAYEARKIFMVPLRAESLRINLADAERKKNTYLSLVSEVVPCYLVKDQPAGEE